jgi:hypothetical protein
MLDQRNLFKALCNPGLGLVLIRRWFPWTAARRDLGCRHMIRAWSGDHFSMGRLLTFDGRGRIRPI